MDNKIAELFNETKLAFERSAIKKYADKNGFNWYYYISSTKLIWNTTVLVGFNGGAENKYDYSPQKEIPEDNFKDLYEKKWLGSLQRIYDPLKKYYPVDEVDNFIQTNFCFFRSKEEKQITKEDLLLSTPLFNKLMEIIVPSQITGFSNKLFKYLSDNKILSNTSTGVFKSNNRTLLVHKGMYRNNENTIPIFFLPHPNAKFTTEARKQGWEFCFRK